MGARAFTLLVRLSRPSRSLNFFYRFAFSAYKTVFALYCAAALGYGAPEVGYVLSCVGLAGIGKIFSTSYSWYSPASK